MAQYISDIIKITLVFLGVHQCIAKKVVKDLSLIKLRKRLK